MLKTCEILIILVFVIIFFGNSESKALTIPAPGDDTYLAFAEVMPEPIGGLEQLNKKIAYPDFAKRSGTEGKVFVLAFINENGDVDDVKIIKGIGMGCDEEVIKAVKNTKFKPASNKGIPIKVKFPVAFAFKLK